MAVELPFSLNQVQAGLSDLPSVLLVEDQMLLRLGLRIALQSLECCEVSGEAADGETAVRETHRLRPDVVLMDVGLPIIDGIEATWRIKQELPRTRVVMFTSHTDPTAVSAAFGAGADAYCAKDAPVEQIACAINAVMRGELWLDPQIADVVVRSQGSECEESDASLSNKEMEILSLIKGKLSSHEIAARLNTNTESIARIMHNIITRFVEQNAIEAAPEQKQRGHLNEWLTAFVDNLSDGTIFNEKFLVQNLIGSGGIGAVFKAKHLFMDRTVALKLLNPETCEDRLAMRSFQREAMAIANLQHKNIVGIYDFGVSVNQEPYLIMEYVNGKNLADIINSERRLSVRRVLHLCEQVCDGLEQAHAKGIVHCDLKPSNLLVSGIPPVETVKLVDFGLVQLMPRDTSPQMQLTDKYQVCGTPSYMSPEQCSGQNVDARADIYALGCIMHEALTGEVVFAGNTSMAVFAKQIQTPAPSLSSVYPEGCFSADLEALVARMLAKDPRERPQSMEEVRASLISVAATA